MVVDTTVIAAEARYWSDLVELGSSERATTTAISESETEEEVVAAIKARDLVYSKWIEAKGNVYVDLYNWIIAQKSFKITY